MFEDTFTVKEILQLNLFTEWELGRLFPNEDKYRLYCCLLYTSDAADE